MLGNTKEVLANTKEVFANTKEGFREDSGKNTEAPA